MALFVDIEKRLGSFLLKVKFEAENEVLAFLGASGCGKSMTLKCIAGIETPDRGKIILDGKVLYDSDKKINVVPQKRKVGYLFQQYALFPNMTVRQNILCGVRDKKRAGQLVPEILRAMSLNDMEQKKPHQLSGGQQQRVALARILVNEPEILLLDEPFSALDSHLRFRLEEEVRQVIRQFGKTVLLVSHDRDEVFRLSDSIATMKNGEIQTIGKKQTVFHEPLNVESAILTGCKNISKVKYVDDTHLEALDWGVTLKVPNAGKMVEYVGIRMHDIRLENSENRIEVRVTEEIENPFSYTIMVMPKGGKSPIGVEIEKTVWRNTRKPLQTISLPPEGILLLKE